MKSYWTNFEPRFGFAATPRKGLVVRGGFGMSRFAQDYASGSMNLYNPPFISQNLDCFPATGTGASACPAGSGTAFPRRTSRSDPADQQSDPRRRAALTPWIIRRRTSCNGI